MKTIDFKSFLIGTLLTSTIFLGVAATGKGDKGKWDNEQVWDVKYIPITSGAKTKLEGFEPMQYISDLINQGDRHILYRKRIK